VRLILKDISNLPEGSSSKSISSRNYNKRLIITCNETIRIV